MKVKWLIIYQIRIDVQQSSDLFIHHLSKKNCLITASPNKGKKRNRKMKYRNINSDYP